MKAIVLGGFGGPENLVITNLPTPDIADNEVLIKVKAIGINPIDIKTRKGKGMAVALKEMHPIILGWDISGTVIKTGSKVNLFKTGDEVFGMINFPGHGKAYAEYVAAPETHLAMKPENISHEEAAAASLAAMTAWQILNERIQIKKGDRVLIHSAAGGVGHYAVQMARHLGAWVACTSSDKNKNFVLSLGTSLFIDYEKEKFENVLNNMDFVLDSMGGEYTSRSFKVLKPGGTIICLPSGQSENITEEAKKLGLIGDHFRVWSDSRNINEIAQMLEKGIVKSFVSKTFTLDDIAEAHLQIESGKTKGKIVIRID
jgi:NADPH:quinone reductase-like Zn-dependent oxidoreductase